MKQQEDLNDLWGGYHMNINVKDDFEQEENFHDEIATKAGEYASPKKFK